MQFSDPPRPTRGDNILPMINVVFLLLVFFLMSAELAPPEPFPVEVPEAAQEDPAEGTLTLYVDSGGQIGFRDALGEAPALAALERAMAEVCEVDPCEGDAPPLLIRADRGVDGAVIAGLLPKLGALGLRDVMLVTALK